MKLVVGLGNPTKEYQNTRHNLGFLVVERLAEDPRIEAKRGAHSKKVSGFIKSEKFKMEYLFARYQGKEFLLAKPMVFMNQSGRAIKKLADYYQISSRELVLIYDDIDLPFGKIRLRHSGSSGGHKGVASVIEAFSSNQFSRIKIGIGRPPTKNQVKDYVLSFFNKIEQAALGQIVDQTISCLLEYLKEGEENGSSKS